MPQESTVAEEVEPMSENNQGTVLLIDDDPLILSALKATLERTPYQILTAEDGKSALEILQAQPVSVIICDLRMPSMSGIEVLKQAQIIRPEAIRIVMTGSTDTEQAIDAINVGQISQFLVKPWEDAQLHQVVHSSIEKYRLIKQNQRLQKLILSQHQELARTHENLRREMLLGAKIHETMLLGKAPTNVPGFAIAALTMPTREIDGDFFEFYQAVHGMVDLVIGDVMGKGIPAALVGIALKTQLTRFAMPHASIKIYDAMRLWHENVIPLQEIISNTHASIIKQLLDLEYFVSLFYGRFNLYKRTFTYIDCGSPKPLHYHTKSKTFTALTSTHFPFGIVEHDTYNVSEVNFEEGDLFVFFSDGVTEARSAHNEMFGHERLHKLVQENANCEAETLMAIIKESVLEFVGKGSFEDDITIIVIKIEKSPPLEFLEPLEAKFSNNMSQLKAVRNFVQRICQNAPGDTETLISQLQLAINEIFCNIVKYAHSPSDIAIKGICLQEGVLLEITDQGGSFDPSQVSEPSLAGDRETGFGWHVIKAIADHIAYEQKTSPLGSNHLRIFKRFLFKGKNMQLLHSKQGSVLVITPARESLDAEEAREFKQKAIDLITNDEFTHVIIDLHELKYIDSSGLGSILSILKLLNTRGGDLKLACMNKQIRTIFELVSMHKIFEIYSTVDDAVRSFKPE